MVLFQWVFLPLYKVVEFKGKWYALHHSAWMSGISESRSLMCDYVTYDENGDIMPIYPDETGVHSTEDDSENYSKVTIWLDAAGAPKMRGKLSGTAVGTEIPGYTGDGYAEQFTGNHFGVTVYAQSSKEYLCNLKIRYCAPDGECLKKIMFNEKMLCPEYANPYDYDKLYKFEKTDEWTTVTVAQVKMKVGENYIRFYNGKGEIKVDAIILEQVMDLV